MQQSTLAALSEERRRYNRAERAAWIRRLRRQQDKLARRAIAAEYKGLRHANI